MTQPASKLSLQEVTAIARELVREDDHEVIGAIPAEGDSEYAELVLALNPDHGSTIQRLTIGVHRAQSADCVREQIASGLRLQAVPGD
jgi:hypothetical protein